MSTSAFGVEVGKSFFPRYTTSGEKVATMTRTQAHADGKVGDWRPVTEAPKHQRTKRLNALRASKFVRESGGPDKFVFGRHKQTRQLALLKAPEGSAHHADGLSDALRGKVQRELYFKPKQKRSRANDVVTRRDIHNAVESRELGQLRSVSRRAVNEDKTFKNTRSQSIVQQPRRPTKDIGKAYGRGPALDAARWTAGMTGVGGAAGGAVYGGERARGAKKEKAKRAAVAAVLGGAAGHGVYQAAGYEAKHQALGAERRAGQTSSKKSKLLKPVKAVHGAHTPAMYRNYPKSMPGAKVNRALGWTHRGRSGQVAGAAATLAGGVAAGRLARKKDKVAKSGELVKLVPITKALSPIAKRVYDDIMALPDEAAALYAQMVVAGAVAEDMSDHHDMVQARVDDIIDERVGRLKAGVVKGFVSKRMAGEDVAGLSSVAETIAKAGFDFTTAERREYVRGQERDQRGRFRTMNRTIDYTQAERNGKLPGRHASRLGIPEDAKSLTNSRERARYQQAYLQVADMVRQFADLPLGEGTLSLAYDDGQRVIVDLPKPSQLTDPKSDLLLNAGKFNDGGKLLQATVITDSSLSAQGAAFDLVGALGSPRVAGRASAAMRQDANGRFAGAAGLESFATGWDSHVDSDVGNPGNRIFRRMRFGSQLLQDIAGDNAPAKVKLALQTGDFIGQYGPEAQKVIGPHADRAAYRYRGVERTPEVGLQRSLDMARQRLGSDDAARNEMIYGTSEDVVTRGGKIRTDATASPIIGYFQRRLTRNEDELGNLQRSSGVVPPSEGIIIDRKGKVVTQAVGYGDDWYLPFNLKTLSKLKGGEYVRTRAWGGPTTEDIYAGLISGARAVTVVSHNGVYTIEFDPAFRGARRYNDKAARMVKRYGHLLDAVKSREVTLASIPADRKEELLAEAAKEADPKTERRAFARAYEELEREEKHEPTMSRKALTEAAAEFLEENAQPKTSSGEHLDWVAIAQSYAGRSVAGAANQPGMSEIDLEWAHATAMRGVDTPEKLIGALGLTSQWERHLSRVTDDYRTKQSPLALDGAGYHKSMQALEEQFPYYISSVSWQPNKRGGQDQGYVKPRFTRPEGALAGYFDPSIEGVGQTMSGKLTGKVTADRTRYQNAGVPRPQARPEPVPDQAGTIRTHAAPPEVAAAREIDDVKALYDTLRNQTTVNHEGQTYPIGDQQRRELADPRMLPTIYGRDWDDLFSEYVSPGGATKVKEAVLAAAGVALTKNLFNDPKIRLLAEKIKDPAKAEIGGEWSVLGGMNAPDKNYDFGEEFGPGRKSELYAHKGQLLLSSLGLNGADFATPAADLALNDYIAKQRATFLSAGKTSYTVDVAKVGHNIEKAVQVKQLARRYHDAAKAEAELAAAREKDLGENSDLVIGSYEDLMEKLRQPFDDGKRTIAGQLG